MNTLEQGIERINKLIEKAEQFSFEPNLQPLHGLGIIPFVASLEESIFQYYESIEYSGDGYIRTSPNTRLLFYEENDWKELLVTVPLFGAGFTPVEGNNNPLDQAPVETEVHTQIRHQIIEELDKILPKTFQLSSYSPSDSDGNPLVPAGGMSWNYVFFWDETILALDFAWDS